MNTDRIKNKKPSTADAPETKKLNDCGKIGSQCLCIFISFTFKLILEAYAKKVTKSIENIFKCSCRQDVSSPKSACFTKYQSKV